MSWRKGVPSFQAKAPSAIWISLPGLIEYPTYFLISSKLRKAFILFIETLSLNISVRMFGSSFMGSLSMENRVRQTKAFSGVKTFSLSTLTYRAKLTSVTKIGALLVTQRKTSHFKGSESDTQKTQENDTCCVAWRDQ